MPLVENVLDHWIEVYSADRTANASADCMFYFGLLNPQDILITTCLSAVTLGVSVTARAVGTAGTRIARYVHFDNKGQLISKQLPLSYDWNSERIPRCVAVVARTTVFYANTTSLSTVYVFRKKVVGPTSELGKLKTIRMMVYDKRTKKAVHSTDIVGPSETVRSNLKPIESEILDTAAKVVGLRRSDIALLPTSTRGWVGSLSVDVERKKLIRPAKTRLSDFGPLDRINYTSG